MKLKIQTVTYRTNVTLGANSYRTKHVEATATIGPKDDPARVLFHLARWVHAQLGLPGETAAPRPLLRNMGDE